MEPRNEVSLTPCQLADNKHGLASRRLLSPSFRQICSECSASAVCENGKMALCVRCAGDHAGRAYRGGHHRSHDSSGSMLKD